MPHRSELPVSTVSLASSAADSAALEAIEHHHAELVGGFAARAAALLAAVRAGRDWREARDALVAWCQTELLPHAESEEAVLYPAARELQDVEQLVRAMSYEHALLGNLVAQLRSANDASAVLMRAGASQTLFEAHVAKENELLLPAMVAAHGISVARLLDEMQASLESHAGHGPEDAAARDERATEGPSQHACGCHDEMAGSPELDARTIPHAIRHATIFGALDAVRSGADLVLVAPHDPLPLLDQIEQGAPGAFSVEYLERGPEAWRLRFTRTTG